MATSSITKNFVISGQKQAELRKFTKKEPIRDIPGLFI